MQWGSHWVHIYNLAFHFMASGNGCFTAFIKACSSQRCVFPLKFSSMNLTIRGHYGPRFQGTVEHCIIWLVLLIKWNTAPFAPISLTAPTPSRSPLLFAISLLRSDPSDVLFPLPPPLIHTLLCHLHSTHALKLTKGRTPSLLKTVIYHFPPSNQTLFSSLHRVLPPPPFAQDINQLRWKFHNCACWEGFEQNCTMNFLKGIFTSCSARLGRRRKVRPWGFMGLDSSLLK